MSFSEQPPLRILHGERVRVRGSSMLDLTSVQFVLELRHSLFRHPGEGRDPRPLSIVARLVSDLKPAVSGVSASPNWKTIPGLSWVPAFAGMTRGEGSALTSLPCAVAIKLKPRASRLLLPLTHRCLGAARRALSRYALKSATGRGESARAPHTHGATP